MNFVDIYRDIVTAAATALSTDIYYEHDHGIEIANTLAEKTASDTYKFQKYPLVAVLHDFTLDADNYKGYKVPEVTVLIITSTNPNFKGSERYDNTFDTILTPICDELLVQMQANRDIQWKYENHSKIERLYWGREGLFGNTANIFNDYIDAIELRLRDITIIKNC